MKFQIHSGCCLMCLRLTRSLFFVFLVYFLKLYFLKSKENTVKAVFPKKLPSFTKEV